VSDATFLCLPDIELSSDEEGAEEVGPDAPAAAPPAADPEPNAAEPNAADPEPDAADPAPQAPRADRAPTPVEAEPAPAEVELVTPSAPALDLASAGTIGGATGAACTACTAATPAFGCFGCVAAGFLSSAASPLVGVGATGPAFLVCAGASCVGTPLLAGFIGKWNIAVGAVEAGDAFWIAILVVSALLNVAYFFPIIQSAFFDRGPERSESRLHPLQSLGTHGASLRGESSQGRRGGDHRENSSQLRTTAGGWLSSLLRGTRRTGAPGTQELEEPAAEARRNSCYPGSGNATE